VSAIFVELYIPLELLFNSPSRVCGSSIFVELGFDLNPDSQILHFDLTNSFTVIFDIVEYYNGMDNAE
jgi:hypothetical protein